MKIKNTSRNNTHNFVLKGEAKAGVPPTGHVGPGETAELDINMDVEEVHVQALVNAGEIAPLDPIAMRKEPKAENAIPSADKATK